MKDLPSHFVRRLRSLLAAKGDSEPQAADLGLQGSGGFLLQ